MYLGRIVGIGRTTSGSPAALYGLSGRSEGSKKRRLKLMDDGFIRRVKTRPLDEPTGEQKRKANIFFYDPMWSVPDLVDGAPYLVVSNGVHTSTIADATSSVPYVNGLLLKSLALFGYERDGLRTPRIAAELALHRTESHGILGIASEEQVHAASAPLENGIFRTVSTYSGKDDSRPGPPVYTGSGDEFTRVELAGNAAGELAASFYAWVDPEYVVSAAAAVWTGQAWDMAVKNLHGDG